MKPISQILILPFLNGIYQVEIGFTDEKSHAHRKVMCPLIYLSFLLTKILLPKLNQLLLNIFFIVDLVSYVEIWKHCFSPCLLYGKLLLISVNFNISKQCLMFS